LAFELVVYFSLKNQYPVLGIFFAKIILDHFEGFNQYRFLELIILSMTKRFIIIGFILIFFQPCLGQNSLKLDTALIKNSSKKLMILDSLGGPSKLKYQSKLDSMEFLRKVSKSMDLDSLKDVINLDDETYQELNPTDFNKFLKAQNFLDSLKSTILRLPQGGIPDLESLDLSSFPSSINAESSAEFLKSFLPESGKEFRVINSSELSDVNKLAMEELSKEADFQEYHAISKRVVSLKDRELVDSARNLVTDKLYRIKESAQDSLDIFLIAEKEKIRDNLFFEGLVNVTKDYDNFSVSDFSGNVGLRLSKLYEIGAGPEIGISNGDFSALGARLFVRRQVLEDRLFAVVENSVGRNIPLAGDEFSLYGMVSNWKIGAGTLFNLSPSGSTKLNFQTLLNPQYLKGGYSNLIDFRFGISKLSQIK